MTEVRQWPEWCGHVPGDAEPDRCMKCYENWPCSTVQARYGPKRWIRVQLPQALVRERDKERERAEKAEALLRKCRDTLREVRQTYGPEPGARVIGLFAILSELDEALA